MRHRVHEEGSMLEIIRRLGTATSSLHRGMKDTVNTVGELLVDAFHYLALFAIGATTVWSAAAAFVGMTAQGHASLGDILLLFIYLEIGAMVGIYFKTTRLPVRYLIYIAITALGRMLIEIVGAEHRTGVDILVVTGAILLLSFAVLVLRFRSVPDLYCDYGARAHADRNCRRRASDRRGHTGCNGRNSPSVIRRPGPKIPICT